jgi:hypothetical protein
VGAAKSLHLLAPRFFPIWDRKIAREYVGELQIRGKNTERYLEFMGTTQKQIAHFGGEKALGRNPLKAIDEYNYCTITKGWSLGDSGG